MSANGPPVGRRSRGAPGARVRRGGLPARGAPPAQQQQQQQLPRRVVVGRPSIPPPLRYGGGGRGQQVFVPVDDSDSDIDEDDSDSDSDSGSGSGTDTDDDVPIDPFWRRVVASDLANRQGDGWRAADGGPSRWHGSEEDDDDEDSNTTTGNEEMGPVSIRRILLAGEEGSVTVGNVAVGGGHRDEGGDRRLHFEMDPTLSYSDWSITIQPTRSAANEDGDDNVNDDDDGIDATVVERTYHVHKCVMAIGSTQSLYFRRAFDLPFRERDEGASIISLEPLAAMAFGTMLEFMYSTSGELHIHDANAVPLRFLARYFEVPALRALTALYIADHLHPTNCHIYYRHASIFQDEDVLKAVETLCSTKPIAVCHMNPEQLLNVTGLDVWHRIMGAWPKSALRRRSSTLLTHLIRVFRDDFTADRFRDFTSPDLLPVVRGMALAKDLLRMEKKLLISQGVDETTLQTRCIDAFVRHQRTTGDAESEMDLTTFLQTEHPLLMGPFLLKILDHERAARGPVRPIRPPPPAVMDAAAAAAAAAAP